jgi:hypothetical protein
MSGGSSRKVTGLLIVTKSKVGLTGLTRDFRWALSALTVLVVARILQDWFHERQHLRELALSRHTSSFTSYVIIHTNSSLRTHLCLAAVIVLGALQIALIWIWQSRLARRW